MTNVRKDLLYRDECFNVIGACIAVYNELSCGLGTTNYTTMN